jgi:2-polyprenyl-3-methyl-5-hydroxy-6-metoxy-1,4-benzoquinol methylase
MLAWAAEYSLRFAAPKRAIVRLRPRICPFERLVHAVPQRSSVLDIGCGNGLFLYLLWRAGRLGEAIGVDANRHAIDSASRALQAAGVSRATLFASATPDGWPTAKYDVVTMIDVMHHVPPSQQDRVLAAACERVKPGGLLIYKDMASRPRWAAALNALHDLIVAREVIRYVDPRHVEQVAASSGLRLERSEDVRIAWYAHEIRGFHRAAGTPAS